MNECTKVAKTLIGYKRLAKRQLGKQDASLPTNPRNVFLSCRVFEDEVR